MASRDLSRTPSLAEPLPSAAYLECLPWSGEIRRGKLRVPRLPVDAVARPRLLQRIADEGRPLILVTAPAGFGKTTFAAQWATQGPPAAWLSIDPRDALLARFWAHPRMALVDTAGDVAAALGEIVSSALAMPHRPLALDLGRLLADELLDVSGVRLVIDDRHLVAHDDAHDFLAGILEFPPPGLQLVITSRVEPPLPLNWMRLRGTLTEIRGDDLLFTASEAESFAAHASAAGRESPDTPVGQMLSAHTRGWAAGLRLVTLATTHASPALEVETRAAGAEPELLAWLLEETLAGRPADDRAILLLAALPDRFNPRLVMAMTAEAIPTLAVRESIDFATRADLCRYSARDDGDWLEFHPLFSDTLRRQLAQEEAPETIRDLHRRAAWLEETGYIDEALDHLIAAGDQAAAAAIVVREIRPALNREDWPSIARWLAKLPADLIRKTPRLVLAQGMVALEARFAQGEVSQQEISTLRGEFDSLRVNSSYANAIDLAGSLESAQRAIQRIDPSHRYELGVAWMHFGVVLAATGSYQEAIHRLEAWVEEAGPEVDAGSIRGYLGLLLVHAQAGSLAMVETTARTVIPLAEQHGLRIMAGWGRRFLGDALYEMNDLDGAVEQYSAVARDYEYAHLKAVREALFGLALAYRATGRQDEAGRALCRAREIAAGLLHDLPVIEATQANLALMCGGRGAAERWAIVHDPDVGGESFGVVIHPLVIRAAILCASDDRKHVAHGLAALDRMRRELVHWRYAGLLVRIDALRAVALLRCGRREAAIEAMRAARAIARPNGHVRSFLDLLPIFPAELDHLAAAFMLPPAAQKALRLAACADAHGDRAARAQSPLEAITEREQEVLGHLVQRLLYREIGDQLYISPHTVKRHVTSIYSKLDVSGRVEAIRVARDMGWTA